MAGTVVIVGQGYVGLPLAIAASKAGFTVIGFDTNFSRTNLLNQGVSYVPDVSNSDLKDAIDVGAYRATSEEKDVDSFDIAVITVPTPLTDGAPDASFITSAAQFLSSRVRAGCAVILESTTYPGTTEELLVPTLESSSNLKAGIDFYVGYSPERIDPGNAIWTLTSIPKLVAGVNQLSLIKIENFYQSIGVSVVRVESPRDAEMAKLIENTFRHVNIALVNELAMFAKQVGVNIWKALDAAGTKPFGYMKFYPGPGVGGHCLPVDPVYLSWAIEKETGNKFQFVKLANEINRGMPDYIVARIISILGTDDLRGKNISLMGLSYKKNTGDVRESASIDLAKLLRQAGAEVYASDPHVREEDWPTWIRKSEERQKGFFDAIVLVVAHDDFDLLALVDSTTPVLDTQNAIMGDNVESL